MKNANLETVEKDLDQTETAIQELEKLASEERTVLRFDLGEDGGLKVECGVGRDLDGALVDLFTGLSPDSGMLLMYQLVELGKGEGQPSKYELKCINRMLSLVADFKPQDGIESVLVTQMVAVNDSMMRCAAKANLVNQPFEAREMNLKFMNNLARTYAVQVETLNKHRGKGQQKMTVEHVHVHQGGQAIIGNVDNAKPEGSKK